VRIIGGKKTETLRGGVLPGGGEDARMGSSGREQRSPAGKVKISFRSGSEEISIYKRKNRVRAKKSRKGEKRGGGMRQKKKH